MTAPSPFTADLAPPSFGGWEIEIKLFGRQGWATRATSSAKPGPFTGLHYETGSKSDD